MMIRMSEPLTKVQKVDSTTTAKSYNFAKNRELTENSYLKVLMTDLVYRNFTWRYRVYFNNGD